MRRLVFLLPLLAGCSNYWTGTYTGRYTISTVCSPNDPIVQAVSGQLIMEESEESDDTVEVSVMVSTEDAEGNYISGSQCIGLTAKIDSDKGTFPSFKCPKSDEDVAERVVRDGQMTIDDGSVKLTLTLVSNNPNEGATDSCVQTFTGSFERMSYQANSSYY